VKKDWRVYAHHILDAIEKIQRIQQRGNILQDDILYDATIRNLQTLSESTQSIPDAYKAKYLDIPWREISGFRNILVHNYLGDIDPLTIQGVVENELPKLQQCMQSLLQYE